MRYSLINIRASEKAISDLDIAHIRMEWLTVGFPDCGEMMVNFSYRCGDGLVHYGGYWMVEISECISGSVAFQLFS